MRTLAAITMLALALGLTAEAQVRGTPASVTSVGANSVGSKIMTPGVPASVTSLGPRGFDAPRFSTEPQPFPTVIGHQPRGDFRFHGRLRHRRQFAFPAVFPVYVPYAPQVVYIEQPPVVIVERSAPTVFERGYEPARVEAEERPRPERPAEPRVYDDPPEQIATLLIFKDGSELEVFNYAIMGDVLHNLGREGPRRIQLEDLDVEATIEANDQRGVLFKLPGRRG